MRADKPGDDGFTLVEVLTSLAVIGVVLTAVTTFFIRSMITVELQGARQAAIQIASDGMERLRQKPGSEALGWIMANLSETVTTNGIRYRRNWDPPTLTALMTVTERVSWDDKNCAGGVCSYVTSTVISTASVEPLFEPASA